MFDEIEKRVFGYPAGKAHMRSGLIKLITSHSTYVEPFCGSAGVFFAKDRSKVEVLSDVDEDVIEAFKAIQALTDSEADALRRKTWKASRETFDKLKKSSPKDRVAKLHRFLFLSMFSYMRNRRTFAPDRVGVESNVAERAIKARDRLKGVKLSCADYSTIVKEHDGKGTFFYFDPPYVGHNAGVGETKFDEEKFVETLKGIKGRFLLTYGVKGKTDFGAQGFRVQKVDQRRTLANATRLSREKILSTLIVANFDAPVFKAFSDVASLEIVEPRTIVDVTRVAKRDGGIHSHILDRKKRETDLDGAHSHMFVIEGEFRKRTIVTLYDGAHMHKLSKEDAERTNEDGKHKHKVRFFSLEDPFDEGSLLDTEPGDGHAHELLTGTTVFDGLHQHDLTLPNGKKIRSLTPAQFAAMRKRDDEEPHFEIPLDGEPRPAVLKLRVDEKSGKAEADLWFDNGNHAVGWALDLHSGEFEIDKARTVADRFSAHGSQHFEPLIDSFVEARSLGALDHGVLKLDGSVEGGSVLHLDSCLFEHGIHTEDSHEYFLTKGDELVGVFEVWRSGIEKWQARLRKSNLLPGVLSQRAVSDELMPPDGVSALPEHVEKMIPPELRFWEAKGEHARELRDALVASQMVTNDRLAIVGGAIRMVSKSVELFELPEPGELLPDWPLEAVEKHFGVKVREAFGNDDGTAKRGTVNFFDLCDAEPDEIESSAGTITKTDGDFVIACVDSPGTRDTLGKLGRVFRFVPRDPRHAIEVTKRIFVSSLPLVLTDGVEWIQKARVEKPFAGFETFDDCVSSQVADGKSEDTARRICGSLQAETETGKAAEDEEDDLDAIVVKASGRQEIPIVKISEERFVLGVVLEPETKDSQGDIYSADEVRKAAHGFMEKFQNVGLQHRKLVNGKVRILESFVAPADHKLGKAAVKKGTWLLGVRVVDDALWFAVKSGKLTGFSIGGSAIRRPEQSS